MFTFYAFCSRREVYFEVMDLLSSVAGWVPLLWYGGAPAVALAFLAHWSFSRRGRPRIGWVASRVLAASVLVLYGLGPLASVVDMANARRCFELWSGLDGVVIFLGMDIAPTLALGCACWPPCESPSIRIPPGFSASDGSGAEW